MLRRFQGLRVIAGATYGETVRRPLFAILLLSFGGLTFLSQFVTLFTFYQEVNVIREMGVGTMTLWAFILLVVGSSTAVTAELEDRTAVVLLSKPVGRTAFLLGKYFGIVGALLTGMVFLALVLLLTLWSGFGAGLLEEPVVRDAMLRGEEGMIPLLWRTFLGANVAVVLEGLLLSFCQIAVLAALCVSISAFFPVVVTVAATTVLFVVGNLSVYMVGSLERTGSGLLEGLAKVAAVALPNFGYFNLQSHFSEGRIISLAYLGGAAAYAALYVAVVFVFSGALFERREIR